MPRQIRSWFVAPGALTLILLFLCPLAIITGYSVLSRGAYGGVAYPWTLENYARVFDSLYLRILWRSIWVAATATVICAMLGFPLALYIARAPASRRSLLLNLVMLPFWTSFLIRTYAWMFLLRDTGLVNSTLEALHMVREPLPLLFNTGAVLLGLVYGYLPFMVLPLYATLEKLDPALLDAASDLGASPLSSVLTIIIPLSKSGFIAGALLVFVPCLGAYLTPDLMGGGKTVMIGNLVQNQFTTARDWPFGSAISLLVMAVVLLAMGAMRRRSEDLL